MAITNRYVSTTGAGAHDGTSEANAYSWTEMVTAINGGAHAGYCYNVKQGTYTLAADDTLTGDGSTTSPCIIRGYKTTIGDATLGRLTTGAVDTSNMPTIAYNSTKRLDASGADRIVFEALNITGNVVYHLCLVGTGCTFVNCKVTNSSNNAAATCIGTNGADTDIIDCDCINTGDSTAYAIQIGHSYCTVHSTRATCAGYGIGVTSSSSAIIVNCVFYSCTTAGIYCGSAARIFPHNNTCYACGDGVRVQSGSTSKVTAIQNHITDSTAYAFNWNANTQQRVQVRNRTRDNASGVNDTSTDWSTGCTYRAVTTDNGAASSDYTNAGSADFTLVSTAVGLGAGLQPYSDIGAVGAVRSAGGLKGVASA